MIAAQKQYIMYRWIQSDKHYSYLMHKNNSNLQTKFVLQNNCSKTVNDKKRGEKRE